MSNTTNRAGVAHTVYVADRRIYLDAAGNACEADNPARHILLVSRGGVLPMETAVRLGLAVPPEQVPGLARADAVSVDHPLYRLVAPAGARANTAAAAASAANAAAGHAIAENAIGEDSTGGEPVAEHSEGGHSVSGQSMGGQSTSERTRADRSPGTDSAAVDSAAGSVIAGLDVSAAAAEQPMGEDVMKGDAGGGAAPGVRTAKAGVPAAKNAAEQSAPRTRARRAGGR